jgi:low affinity Fe/Cu permease
MNTTKAFTGFANTVSRYTGRPVTFLACVVGVVIWGLCGPAAQFSETWQLVINTTTTIVTFLMVFLIQNTQNRDNAAIQAKLDELIRVGRAKNGFIGIEKLTDRELEDILASFDDETLSPQMKLEIVERSAKKKTVKRQSKTASLRKKDAQAVNKASSKKK